MELHSGQLLRRLLRGDLARHSSLVFASAIAVNACNYVFHFTISRHVGLAEYGDLYALLSLLTLTSVPVASLTMVVVRCAAEFHVLGDTARLSQLANWVFQRTVSVAALLFVLGALLSKPLAAYLAIRDSREVIAAAVVLAMSIVSPAVRGILQGVQDFGRYAISVAIEASCKAILGISFVVAGFGVVGALIGLALAILISIVYSAFAARRHVGTEHALFKVDSRRLYITTAGVTVAMFALTTLSSIDTILVKHFFPSEVAGLYSAVSLVGKALFFIVGFIPTVVLPKVTARAISGADSTPLFLQAVTVMATICGGGLMLLAIVPAQIVTAMTGSAFRGAAPYVLPYGIAMTLLAITSVAVAYKVGTHRFDFVPSLIAVAIAEIAAMTFYHPNLYAIVHVLIGGHALALACTTYRISAGAGMPLAERLISS